MSATVFPRLVALMRRLRAPNGCPWDRQQTHRTLRPYLLEETHEVLEALDSRRPERLKDELGDLLFQIIFHAQLAAEARQFTIEDVVQGCLDKMTRRHPHLFGGTKLHTSRQVLENWEEIKRRERDGSGRSLLEGVPRTLPALLRAHRVQAKAAHIGFTWSKLEEAMTKVGEEMNELQEALALQRPAAIHEELGDVFFSLVNLARFAGANPEEVLHQAVAKFIRRFARVEKLSQQRQLDLSKLSSPELLELWEQGKRPRPRKPARPSRARLAKKNR